MFSKNSFTALSGHAFFGAYKGVVSRQDVVIQGLPSKF